MISVLSYLAAPPRVQFQNTGMVMSSIIYITNRELSEWPQVAEDKHLMETLTQKITSGSQLIRL